MKRKLIWINLLLAGLVTAAGVRIHDEWEQQKAREAALHRNPVKPKLGIAPGVTPIPAPVAAATYNEVAQRMIFSKDRNPTVIVEVPPVVVVPPPPPMPALPILRGVMGLPSGMIALLSETAAARNVGVHVGEMIGPFKLHSVTRDQISFEWTDKIVTKRVSEMMYNAPDSVASAPQASAVNATAATSTAPGKPGVDIVGGSNGYKVCNPNDPSPNGTVADGMKKVVTPNPFGTSCHWEPVQ